MNTMAILNPDDQIELARFGDVKSPLVVALTSFNGIRYLDVRRYYFDKLTGQLKPTPKGIALKEEEFSNLLELFLETGDKVKKMYGSDLSAIELAGRSNAKEARARKKASEKAEKEYQSELENLFNLAEFINQNSDQKICNYVEYN